MSTKEIEQLRVELTNLVRAKFKPPYFDEEMRILIDSNIMNVYKKIKEAEKKIKEETE